MKTKKWAMGLVLLSTLSAASGQILIKMGTNNLEPEMIAQITDLPFILPRVLPLIIGYCLYGLSAIMLVVSLKYGELSVLYPIYAMNFIWVALMVPVFFPYTDSMNGLKWMGVIAIVVGVTVIGLGSRGEGHG